MLWDDGYRDVGKLYQFCGNTSKKQGFDPRMADPADNDLSGTLLLGYLKQDICHLTMADNAESLNAFAFERLQYRIQHSLLGGFDLFFRGADSYSDVVHQTSEEERDS